MEVMPKQIELKIATEFTETPGPRFAKSRARLDIIDSLCMDLQEDLRSLRQIVGAAGERNQVFRQMQTLDNSAFALKEASKMAKVMFSVLNAPLEDVRQAVTDPLTHHGTYTVLESRQIDGKITAMQVAVVQFRIKLNS